MDLWFLLFGMKLSQVLKAWILHVLRKKIQTALGLFHLGSYKVRWSDNGHYLRGGVDSSWSSNLYWWQHHGLIYRLLQDWACICLNNYNFLTGSLFLVTICQTITLFMLFYWQSAGHGIKLHALYCCRPKRWSILQHQKLWNNPATLRCRICLHNYFRLWIDLRGVHLILVYIRVKYKWSNYPFQYQNIHFAMYQGSQ